MKLNFTIGIMLWSAALFAQEKGIRFDQALNESQLFAAAKAQHKYIFIDVFATWCGPCKMMDRDVYTNDTVAAIANEQMIALKLQMDVTPKDDAYVRKWYETAKRYQKQYEFPGYPSYLILSPDGEAVLQDVGYKTPAQFIALLNSALDPKRLTFNDLIRGYRRGEKHAKQLGELSVYARDVRHDKPLADSLANDYKLNYIDQLTPDQLLADSAACRFMDGHNQLIKLDDPFFKICYEQPAEADKRIGAEGHANWLALNTVNKEELHAKLTKNDRPVYRNVDWAGLYQKLSAKYAKLDLSSFFLQYQTTYYRFVDNNWRRWADYKEEGFRRFPPESAVDAYINLNVYGAWDAFQYCKDPEVLRRVVKWADQVISMKDPVTSVMVMDTKANLLYKLGDKRKALILEKNAVALDKDPNKEIAANYRKMLKNEPTWPSK